MHNDLLPSIARRTCAAMGHDSPPTLIFKPLLFFKMMPYDNLLEAPNGTVSTSCIAPPRSPSHIIGLCAAAAAKCRKINMARKFFFLRTHQNWPETFWYVLVTTFNASNCTRKTRATLSAPQAFNSSSVNKFMTWQ